MERWMKRSVRILTATGFLAAMTALPARADLRLEKPVAVKVMARELAANPDALLRFHREARVTSGLGHPNIVQVFDFSTTPSGGLARSATRCSPGQLSRGPRQGREDPDGSSREFGPTAEREEAATGLHSARGQDTFAKQNT
jgi:serine/threonine protein kinase